MDLQKLLDTKEKRHGVIASLRQLYQSEGWQFIIAVLENNVDRLQDMINDTESTRDEKEEWRLKVKREYQKQLVDLPKKFAEDLLSSDDKQWHELDPYE